MWFTLRRGTIYGRGPRRTSPEANGLQDSYHECDKLYFLPVGGTAMAPLAVLLAEMGHDVRGVDAGLYPPMSTVLEEASIPVRIGWDPAAIPTDVRRVVVGNAVPRGNPEVAEVLARRLPFLSQAEAVAHYLLARGHDSLVVAGTHGKTTTTAMLAWILESSGDDPSYLVGGLLPWSRRAHRLGAGRWAVLEGDEYNAAFFDRGPKFLHYRPHLFVLGPVEYDHADLYPSLEAVLTAFRAGTAQVPRDGAVVVNGFGANALQATRDATAEVVLVGGAAGCAVRLASVRPDGAGSRIRLELDGGRLDCRVPLAGRHNAENAAVALAAAVRAGVAPDVAAEALAAFPGVARRMEVVGEAAGVTVVDDFAHHPTALRATVAAARERWPGRRLVVAFEPRSLSAVRREFEAGYVAALAAADLAIVAPAHHRERVAPEQLLDPDRMAATLGARDVPARALVPDEDPVVVLLALVEAGDVVLACSSGDFSNLHRRLLAALGGSSSGPDGPE